MLYLFGPIFSDVRPFSCLDYSYAVPQSAMLHNDLTCGQNGNHTTRSSASSARARSFLASHGRLTGNRPLPHGSRKTRDRTR